MKPDARVLFIAGALALGACSGNFASGTGMPQSVGGMPPVNSSPMPANGQNGLPQEGRESSPPPPGTYSIAQASTGLACPATTDGYDCTLKFNLPSPTPSPKPGTKAKPTPSPTPSPTPTPSPQPSSSDDNGDESPTPSPTPMGPSVTLKADANPKGAPPMVHTPANTLDVVPLMMVSITANGDFPISGNAVAQFTLPQEQIAGRGFAVQLFQETTSHRKTSYNAIWTFDKSYLSNNTLTFNYTPPKMTIAKGTTYALVLYGDDKSKQTPSPKPTATPKASASPSTSPAASASPSASPDAGE